MKKGPFSVQGGWWGGKKKGKKGPFGKNSNNHNKATYRSLAIRHMRPPLSSPPSLPANTHSLFFEIS